MSPTSSTKTQLYDQVVTITYEYLGPAAERFIARQVRNHLKKEPESLGKRDLRELIDWIKLAMAFLSDDDTLVNNYVGSLRELANGGKLESSGSGVVRRSAAPKKSTKLAGATHGQKTRRTDHR